MNARIWTLITAAAMTQGVALAQYSGQTYQGQPDSRQDRNPDWRNSQNQDRQDRNSQNQRWQNRSPQSGRVDLVQADTVLGARVVGQDGQRIGEINDLIVSPASDRVEFALLQYTGGNMGGQIIPIPWQTLSWDSQNQTLTLPFGTERLNGAPTINRNEWNRLSEPNFRSQTLNYFGASQFTQTGAWQNAVNTGNPVTLRGTIDRIETIPSTTGSGSDRVLILDTQNGSQEMVNIGPVWFVDHQRQMFRQGQQVEIKGYSTGSVNGQEVVLAKSLSTPFGRYQLRNEQGQPVWDIGNSSGSNQYNQPNNYNNQGYNNQGRYNSNDRDNDQDMDRDNQNSGQNQGRRGHQRDNQGYGSQQGYQGQSDQSNQNFQNYDRNNGAMGYGGSNYGNGTSVVRVSTLKGEHITTADNQDFGRLDTLVFNADNGKIAYAVANVGGFLGIGNTEYAIPWKAFNVDTQGRLTVNQLDEQTLRGAPTVQSRNGSELQDPQFAERVYQHFGMTPDWQTSGSQGQNPSNQYNWNDRSGMNGQSNSGSYSTSSNGNNNRNFKAGPDMYQQLFSQGEQTSITGTVDHLDYSGNAGMVDLVVRSGQGQQVIKLAPSTYLEKIDLQPQQGDQVSVQGRNVLANGRNVVVAQSVSINGQSYDLRDSSGRPTWRTPR